MKKRRAGFTLVELLIVISIIGILTTMVVAAVGSSRAVARDGKRISDMKEIELALAIYFDVNRSYPANLNALLADRYFSALPTDPSSGAAYEYNPLNGNKGYCIGVKLEGNVPDDSATCDSGTPQANYKSMR